MGFKNQYEEEPVVQVMMFGGSDIGRVRKINQDYFFF